MTTKPRGIPRIKLLLLVFGMQAITVVAFTSEAPAGAFGQLLDAAGGGLPNVPPVSNPECVSGCDGNSEPHGRDDEGGGNRGIWGLVDRWQEAQQERRQQQLQQQQEQERQNKQEAFNLNERGNKAFEKREWTTAVDLYRQALAKSPRDKVIQQNLHNAEQEKASQEELRKEQSEYRKRMEKLVALMPVNKPLSKHEKVSAKVPLPGFTREQWKEYLDAQETVARLYAKLNRDGVLSDPDSATFYSALRRRNELYATATAQPLPAEEREKIRLFLPQVVNKALLSSIMQMFRDDQKPAASQEPRVASADRRVADSTKQEPSRSDAITTAFVADFFSDKITDSIEEESGEAIERARGEKYRGRYEKLIDLGHIAVKAREGGVAAAGAETADLVISKIPEPLGPHAEFAVEGGRMYSKVAYEALNRFMTDAMKGTGATFDREAFWREFNNDLTKKQKGVKEWVTFGE